MPPTSPSASTSAAGPTRPMRTTRPTPPSSSTTGSSSSSTRPGACASAATISSPSRSTARTARRSPACTAAGPSTASTPRARSGTRTSRRPWTSTPSGTRCRTTSPFDNGFKAQWEEFIRHVVEDAPYRYDLMAGASGRAARGARPQELGRAALGRCAEPRGVTGHADRQPADPKRHDRGLRDPERAADAAGRVATRRASTASPTRPPTSSPIPWPTAIPGWTSRSTGSGPSLIASISGTSASGVAEAMDTAQRGMGLDWPAAKELIRRALDAARHRPDALIACGAGTDHLPPAPPSPSTT